MSQEAVRVKEEPEWENGSDSCVSEATARAGLHADREIKYELEIGPELQQPPPAVFPDQLHIKVEVELVEEEIETKEEAVHVKEEAGCRSSVESSSMSEAAGLYANHMVKGEFVLRPEGPQDAAFALQAAAEQAGGGSGREPEPERPRRGPRREVIRREVAEDGPRAGACGQQPGPPSATTAPGHKAAPRPECPTCHKQFNYPSNLKIHMRTHTGEKPCICKTCKKQFADSSTLRRHELIHTGEKRYSCDICKKQFTDSTTLKKHKRIHTGEKRYSCDICKKLFTQLGSLKRHLQIHTGEKHYSCDICKKKFTRASNLKEHEIIHTGEKPYSCDICKKQFRHLSTLKKHELIHTGEKRYICDFCDKPFARKSCLVRHILTHWSREPSETRHAARSSADKPGESSATPSAKKL